MNILLFGPNGSGKGTQGAILQTQFRIQHIESGIIFRDHISKNTELGRRAKQYIEKGELVPDHITIPMILDRLKEPDCAKGWLLDGFPRNLNQARELDEALTKERIKLAYVIEIVLERQMAKNRIMGRRLCIRDNNHPNNIFIEAIKPLSQDGGMVCRVCGGELKTRSDDQDELAIDQRHAIYYDKINGTLAAAHYFREKAKNTGSGLKFIAIDGRPGVKEVSEDILKRIQE